MLNKNVLLFLPLSLLMSHASANVVIGGTRVVYPENEKEVTVKVNNTGAKPVLIQSWIDDGNPNANPDTISVPFILKPPLNRIDAGKGQSLRLTYVGGTLARDRETLYWLNVLEVPSVNQNSGSQNNLQIAYRTRLKIFYRPNGLDKDLDKSMGSLKWHLTANSLEAKNDSPYYVNLLDVRVKHAGQQKIIDADMVPPFGTASFPLKGEIINKSDMLIYDYINDWGALNSINFTLQ